MKRYWVVYRYAGGSTRTDGIHESKATALRSVKQERKLRGKLQYKIVSFNFKNSEVI